MNYLSLNIFIIDNLLYHYFLVIVTVVSDYSMFTE
jgi:hypothetical protein